jgi:branched-chain amino acid transport system ATP-binding protein
MRVIRELTDRVVVLDWGEVIAEGPYAEVSNDPRVITAYLGEEA